MFTQEISCSTCLMIQKLTKIEKKIDSIAKGQDNEKNDFIHYLNSMYVAKKELMNWLGVKSTWIWEKEKTGALALYKISRNSVFCKRSDVMQLIENSKVKSD